MEKFKSKDVFDLFKISRQRLKYWRKVGLITAFDKTQAGHFRYSYHDLVALKTIKTLSDSGFSTQHITKVFNVLKNRFGNSTNPFVQKSIVVADNRIAYVLDGKLYDAITGQGFLFEVIMSEEIEYEVKRGLAEKRRKISETIFNSNNKRTIFSTKKKRMYKSLKS